MASGSATLAVQKRRRMPTQGDKEYLESSAIPETSRQDRKASPEPANHTTTERPRKQKRPREDETISEARVDFWTEKGTWPTEEQEKTMDRFRDIVHHALARKRSSASLRRKRSDTSINAETVLTRTPSDQQPRQQKSQLKERGSFMGKYEEGTTAESKELCQKLLRASQSPPEHTLFDDNLFEDTLELIKGRNETRVIRDIALLIIPPAEILAIRGAKRLKILRETTNADWNNAIPFCGPRPQPDYGLGFKREAFNREQIQKLQPFIGNEMEGWSYVAATYDMYLPFLTCEVKCGAAAMNIADRQNAHNRTVALQNLVELFRLVGREKELNREVNGFSISHSDVDIRIWGHYAVIDGRDATFYRHPIGEFSIKNTELDRGKRRICSAIDMLPTDLNFEVSDQPEPQFPDQERASSNSGLSLKELGSRYVEEGMTASLA
ncbi:hypothetical protein K469DRAFT_740566 [Zopfia rhizophila CBS 207.26]|uniref:DUF7924 domain-containing protein n=1 Tax=Zopfia rhizophila CBS 207.26 TaxID=1314779 RepID=A0A6A6DSN1_9PEZI|nr:hypothetical protein K469DRAFT_740566 [Zopfia rhizophila CBS 207.26]